MTIPANICGVCRNYRADDKCQAFPDGIPTKILLGQHDHRKPYKGDNGIRYKPIRTEGPRDAESK